MNRVWGGKRKGLGKFVARGASRVFFPCSAGATMIRPLSSASVCVVFYHQERRHVPLSLVYVLLPLRVESLFCVSARERQANKNDERRERVARVLLRRERRRRTERERHSIPKTSRPQALNCGAGRRGGLLKPKREHVQKRARPAFKARRREKKKFSRRSTAAPPRRLAPRPPRQRKHHPLARAPPKR